MEFTIDGTMREATQRLVIGNCRPPLEFAGNSEKVVNDGSSRYSIWSLKERIGVAVAFHGEAEGLVGSLNPTTEHSVNDGMANPRHAHEFAPTCWSSSERSCDAPYLRKNMFTRVLKHILLVTADVFACRQNLKVLWAIVVGVAVLVMDVFVCRKRSTDRSLGHGPMLQFGGPRSVFSFHSDLSVSPGHISNFTTTGLHL